MIYIQFIILTCLLLCDNCKGKIKTTSWNNHRILDKKGLFHLKWFTTKDSVIFKAEVKTNGYVGFGFSPDGSMKASDIVTGWVKDGKTYFQDRHGKGNFLPEIDESQDWNLIEGRENETHTTLIFYRKLDTCDEDDLPIENKMVAIYAFDSKDPSSLNQLRYHGWRGSQTIHFLQGSKSNMFH